MVMMEAILEMLEDTVVLAINNQSSSFGAMKGRNFGDKSSNPMVVVEANTLSHKTKVAMVVPSSSS